MTTRRAADNTKALDAFMTTKFQIDAMLERLKALSDDHFDTHPDEPNPGSLQSQSVVERSGCRVDVTGHVGVLTQGPRPGDRREVGETHSKSDGATDHPCRAHACGGAIGQPKDLSMDNRGVVDVVREGLV